MATRWGEDRSSWFALVGSLCSATAMILAGMADGWNDLRAGIAVMAGLVVVGVAVEIVRQRRQFRHSRRSGLDDT